MAVPLLYPPSEHPFMLAACPPAQVQHGWMPHFLIESPALLQSSLCWSRDHPQPQGRHPACLPQPSLGSLFPFPCPSPRSGTSAQSFSLPCRHPSRASPLPTQGKGQAFSPGASLPLGSRKLYQESGLSLTSAWPSQHSPNPAQSLEAGGRPQGRRVRGPPTSPAGASPPCSRTPRRVTVARRATSSFMVAAALAARLAWERVVCPA